MTTDIPYPRESFFSIGHNRILIPSSGLLDGGRFYTVSCANRCFFILGLRVTTRFFHKTVIDFLFFLLLLPPFSKFGKLNLLSRIKWGKYRSLVKKRRMD